MSFSITNNHQQINTPPRVAPTAVIPVIHGSLECREVKIMTGDDEESLQNIYNTLKQVSLETSSRPKRVKLDKTQINAYHQEGKKLSNAMFRYRHTPHVQKEELSKKCDKNSYAAYLLATILLEEPENDANVNQAIVLLKNYLAKVHEEFGIIHADSIIAKDYFYAHYLLGKYLNKDKYQQAIKAHLNIAGIFEKYKYRADRRYGDMLFRENKREESIQHWKMMIDNAIEFEISSYKLGSIYNRLGCSFVAEKNSTIEDLKKGIKAFKKGKEYGYKKAEGNLNQCSDLLSLNAKMILKEHPEPVLRYEINEQVHLVARSPRDLQLHNLNHPNNIFFQRSDYNELTIQVQPLDYQKPSTPLSEKMQEGLNLLKEAAGYGNAEAIRELIAILAKGREGIPANPKKALLYRDMLAKQEENAAFLKQVDIFVSLAKTSSEPLQWITRAINAINSFKITEPNPTENVNQLLAELLFQKAEIFLNQNLPAADCIIVLLKESADYENLAAIKRLAEILTYGKSTFQQNYKEALPYWKKLAQRLECSDYLIQVDILIKSEEESIELINKVIQLLCLFVEAKPESATAAKELLAVYLYKKYEHVKPF